MFGTSGIRGAYGETVEGRFAVTLGRAVGRALSVESVVVGRDPRTTGELLSDALSTGLREVGCDVIDIGVAATPTIARSVGWQDADLGVAVTASHNPPSDNGFKLWRPSGQAIDGSQREAITAALEADEKALADWDDVGSATRWGGAQEAHTDALVEAITLDSPPAVVVDVGNGAGGVTADALERLGCDVTTLNAQPDGRFPGRESEPTSESLAALSTLVAETGADVGVAHDGDADRMLAVDDHGEFVPGDELLALFGRQLATPGERVAAPVNTSVLVDDALEAVGATVTRTRVGDGYVADATTESDVVFGGEPSGAWIWPAETLCPDGPLAACTLVELIDDKVLLSAQRAALPTYPLKRDSVQVEEKSGVFSRVEHEIGTQFEDVQTLDGVRVEMDEGWFLIRPSGTQPLIRITAEGRTDAACADYFDTAIAVVEAAIDETARGE